VIVLNQSTLLTKRNILGNPGVRDTSSLTGIDDPLDSASKTWITLSGP
jgi:hypothetical protein